MRSASGILLTMREATAVVVGTVLLAASAACSAPSPAAPAPPAGASASVVLDAYLRDLVAGHCAAARELATETFTAGHGELCGAVKVSAYSVQADPATPSSGEMIFSAVLTTGRSGDGSIAPGRTTWFYDLRRQGGEWRIVGGGSGP